MGKVISQISKNKERLKNTPIDIPYSPGQTHLVNKSGIILNKPSFIALVDNKLYIYSVYLILKTLYIGISKLDAFALPLLPYSLTPLLLRLESDFSHD
ncbi:hypothetical protein [Dapis sp. BLCC M229]|uniref:hypothetical protein n=1 Tax=Dapis sp. BLCC M229 TaxID=3400188 RepID=UPI003CF9BD11